MTDDRRTLVPTDHTFAVPPHVATCPYCKATLTAWCTAWSEDPTDSGRWEADTVEVECDAEPDIDGDDWPEWDARHSVMPYVHWLPMTRMVERWINRCFRFDVDGEDYAS